MNMFYKNEKMKTVICLPQYSGSIFTNKGLTKQGKNIFASQANRLTKYAVKNSPNLKRNELFCNNLYHAFLYLLLDEVNLIDKERTKTTDLFNDYIDIAREISKENEND